MQVSAAPQSDANGARIDALVEIARDFGSRGWTPATSGNYSVRLDDGTIMVTRSGADKRKLTRADLMLLDAAGSPLEDARPSAETLLHVQIYRHDPSARAVLHVHSPAATVMSRRAAASQCVRLENYELLKALRGVESHAVAVDLPVVANDQDMHTLAAEAARWLARTGTPPAYLIEGHGIYAWGSNVAEAARHLEALDFMLECELLEIR